MSWPLVEISEVAEIYSGAGFPKEFQGLSEGDYPFAKVGDISKAKVSEGTTISSAVNHVSSETASRLRATIFPTGSIVFAKIGEAIRKNNRCITTREMAFDNNVMGIHFDQNAVLNDFAFRFLDTLDFHALSNSTTVPSIRKGDVGRIKIPLPPLEEQKRIAGILDQADALRRLRTRALDKLGTLGQAIFHEMFVKGGQPTGVLSDILTETQIGPFGSLLHKSDYVSGGTSLINPMHINGGQIQPDPKFSVTDEKLEELRRYILRPGDIIMGRRGEMGRCAVISATDPQLICGTGSMVLRVDPTKTTPEFLAFFLSTDAARGQLENAASGVTMPNLNTKSLDAVSVPVPSFARQEEFSKLIKGLEQQAKTASRLQQMQHVLFASLQHRAFRGEI